MRITTVLLVFMMSNTFAAAADDALGPASLCGSWRFDMDLMLEDARFEAVRSKREFALGAASLLALNFEFSKTEAGKVMFKTAPSSLPAIEVEIRDGFLETRLGVKSMRLVLENGAETLIVMTEDTAQYAYYRVFNPAGTLGGCWMLDDVALERQQWWRMLPASERSTVTDTTTRLVIDDRGWANVYVQDQHIRAQLVERPCDGDDQRCFGVAGDSSLQLRLTSDGRGTLEHSGRVWPLRQEPARAVIEGKWQPDVERIRTTDWFKTMPGVHDENIARMTGPGSEVTINKQYFEALGAQCTPIGANLFGIVAPQYGAPDGMISACIRVVDHDRIEMLPAWIPVPYIRSRATTKDQAPASTRPEQPGASQDQ